MLRFHAVSVLLAGCAASNQGGVGAAGKEEETATVGTPGLELSTTRYDDSGDPERELVREGGAIYVEWTSDAGNSELFVQVLLSLRASGCEQEAHGEASLQNELRGLDARVPLRLYCTDGAATMTAGLVGRVPADQYDGLFAEPSWLRVVFETGAGVPADVDLEVMPTPDGCPNRSE